MTLAPGNTWEELLPTSESISVVPPAAPTPASTPDASVLEARHGQLGHHDPLTSRNAAELGKRDGGVERYRDGRQA